MGAYGEEWLGPLDAQGVTDLIAFLRSYQEVEVEMDETWTPARDDGELALGLDSTLSIAPFAMVMLAERFSLSLNNPTFLDTASDDFLRYAVAKGRRGTAMGGYDTTLSSKDIASLVLAIRSFGEQTGE